MNESFKRQHAVEQIANLSAEIYSLLGDAGYVSIEINVNEDLITRDVDKLTDEFIGASDPWLN